MPRGDQRIPATRAETDAGLRAERLKTDEEFARRRAEEAEDADSVLTAARDRTDSVLEAARSREDAKRVDSGASGVLDEERAGEDAEIAEERALADSRLEVERVHRQVALASLLAAERQETDSRLLLERARTDDALTNRDDFLAMVSHDLRSLLGGVALNAAMIERDRQQNPAHTSRFVAAIQRTTAQMTRLVADLLDVASVDSGKLILVRATHDACMFAREAVEALEATAREKHIALSVDVPKETVAAVFDPDRIAQVLANLLSNAVKFTHAGGRVSVSVSRRPDGICFCVADTGEGIPSDKLEAIFDRYSQLGRSDRRGLGLGLYISKQIVHAHGDVSGRRVRWDREADSPSPYPGLLRCPNPRAEREQVTVRSPWRDDNAGPALYKAPAGRREAGALVLSEPGQPRRESSRSVLFGQHDGEAGLSVVVGSADGLE